jgi:coatomer subunit beta
MGGDIF